MYEAAYDAYYQYISGSGDEDLDLAIIPILEKESALITWIRVFSVLVGVACMQTLISAVTRRDLVTFVAQAAVI